MTIAEKLNKRDLEEVKDLEKEKEEIKKTLNNIK